MYLSMQLDDDSTQIGAHLGRTNFAEAPCGSSQRSLCVEAVGCQWLVGSLFSWARKSTPGLTPHIQLRDVNFRLDSLSAQGNKHSGGYLALFSMNERSGADCSVTQRSALPTKTIRLPQRPETPHCNWN